MVCECDGTYTIVGIGSVVDDLDGSNSSIALTRQSDIYPMYNVNISKLFSGFNHILIKKEQNYQHLKNKIILMDLDTHMIKMDY